MRRRAMQKTRGSSDHLVGEKPTVEDRLTSLERESAELKNQVNGNDSDKSNWIAEMSGQFRNDIPFCVS